MTDEQCDRSWEDTHCGGEIIQRVTAGGSLSYTCEAHLEALQQTLDAIADRYPEMYHQQWCECSGCEGAW
jgi:hypothetical protein